MLNDPADNIRDRQCGNDGKDHNGVEEVIVQHPEVFPDGGGGKCRRKLRNRHYTGTDTLSITEITKLECEPAGEDFAAHKPDHRQQNDRQIVCRTEKDLEVGLHPDGKEKERDQQTVSDPLQFLEESRSFVIRFHLDDPGKSQTCEEGADNQIDAEQFAADNRQQDDKEETPGNGVFSVGQQFQDHAAQSRRKVENCHKINRNDQKKYPDKRIAEDGWINIIKNGKRFCDQPFRSVRIQDFLHLHTHRQQNDTQNIRNDR